MPDYTLYLHSIMLLLYRMAKVFRPDIIMHLHSIMLLLYRGSRMAERRELKSTFHYASTLSKTYDLATKVNSNLHSIMLLLYRIALPGVILCFFIYIPLCFYFIYSGCRKKTPVICIYIPLCFYFIYLLHVFRSNALSSTFHYASTLSAGDRHKHDHDRQIYIPLCFYFIGTQGMKRIDLICIYIPLCFYFIGIEPSISVPVPYLHSIMLLLYRRTRSAA